MKHYPLNLNTISNIVKSQSTCILLDNAKTVDANNSTYLFYDPVKTIVAHDYSEIDTFLEEIDECTDKYWLCGYLAYEAAYALEDRFSCFKTDKPKELPLGWFGVFERPCTFDHRTGKWDSDLPFSGGNGSAAASQKNTLTVEHLIEESLFHQKIETIRQAIKEGETYQVNFTYDVAVKTDLAPFDLFKELRRRQRTPYCAFLQNEYGSIASLSPELFFSVVDGAIATKPMKGTAPRGHSADEDLAQVSFLEQDEKNRAENLMIVDLLRNDLGRICQAGTVITEKLFEVETHPTVHQMTSTVTGKLKPDLPTSGIFRNIFPCGSVTGAPKIRTMELIHELETGCRGVYCGAIGLISPQGNAAFNVPIRTLQKGVEDAQWRFRVGSGIIWDSSPAGEWQECADKCRFLAFNLPGFDLLETLLLNGEFLYAKEHILRMQSSADYFGYPFSAEKLEGLMGQIQKELDGENKFKVRILLGSTGELQWDYAVIESDVQTSEALLFSDSPVDEKNTLLFHKTTHRPWFKGAVEEIRANRCFDVVYVNSKGEITEGARSNIFINTNGNMYTPPVSCGLLPGVLRNDLLQKGRCKEKILYKDDILGADTVYCGNSVRGLVKVSLPT